MIVQGADEAAAGLRRAAQIDGPLRSDLQEVAKNIKADYQAGVGRVSGRTAAGVHYETSVTAGGLQAVIGNTHFVARFHEHGTAHHGPNPALQQATAAHVPSWVEQVAQRRSR